MGATGGLEIKDLRAIEGTCYVMCKTNACRMTGPDRDTPEEAAAAWNAISARVVVVEELYRALADLRQWKGCFCEAAARVRDYDGKHSPACEAARTALDRARALGVGKGGEKT